jgi:hypothetical protein
MRLSLVSPSLRVFYIAPRGTCRNFIYVYGDFYSDNRGCQWTAAPGLIANWALAYFVFYQSTSLAHWSANFVFSPSLKSKARRKYFTGTEGGLICELTDLQFLPVVIFTLRFRSKKLLLVLKLWSRSLNWCETSPGLYGSYVLT